MIAFCEPRTAEIINCESEIIDRDRGDRDRDDIELKKIVVLKFVPYPVSSSLI